MTTTPEQIDLWRSSPSENQRLEFKEAKQQYDVKKLNEYCVALANEGGGVMAFRSCWLPCRHRRGHAPQWPRAGISHWPIIGNARNRLSWKNAKLAMAVSGKNRHYHLASIMRRHFKATAAKCGVGDNAEDIIGELLAKVEGAIDAVAKQLPERFPQDVAAAIFEGMRTRAKRLHEQPAA